MIIRPAYFLGGMEVDCAAHYLNKGKRGRLSIRKAWGEDGEYELYIKYHQYPVSTAPEEVILKGSLVEVVQKQNDLLGYRDTVEES